MFFLISFKFIFTSSESRNPQFKKNVIMQKSLFSNFPEIDLRSETLSSRVKYFGNLFESLGVSSSTVGFLSNIFCLKVK